MKTEIPYRLVSTYLWRDEKFISMPDDAQLAWIHAYTSTFSNGMGLFHASLEALAAEKRWKADRYKKAINIAIGYVSIRYDERLQQVYFPRFFKWNLPQNPKHFQGMLSHWKSITDSPFKKDLFQYLSKTSVQWGGGYKKVIDTYADTYIDTLPIQEQEQEQEQEIKTPPPPKGEIGAQFILPDWIDAQTWQDFETMRTKIKKSLTPKARILAIANLQKLREAGEDISQVIDQSIFNCWAGFFPVKRATLNNPNIKHGRNCDCGDCLKKYYG